MTPRARGLRGEIFTAMPAEELWRRGRSTIGKGWQKKLGALLGVSPITVNRWASGKQPVSPAMALAIVAELARYDEERRISALPSSDLAAR